MTDGGARFRSADFVQVWPKAEADGVVTYTTDAPRPDPFFSWDKRSGRAVRLVLPASLRPAKPPRFQPLGKMLQRRR
jgi:hypothetical protein